MNSPFRAAAKMLSIRSAIGAGAPCARTCSRKASSGTTVRVKGRPVVWDAMSATVSKSSAAGPVSGGGPFEAGLLGEDHRGRLGEVVVAGPGDGAVGGEGDVLRDADQHLLREWLTRLAADDGASHA